MRFLVIAITAALLILPATRQAKACELNASAAEPQAPVLMAAALVTQQLSAEEKKLMKKTVKKHAKKKMKKEKVEYMRAAPMK